MKLSKDQKEQITTAFVIARMENLEDLLNEALRTPLYLNRIETYGEVTGTNINRNLKSESHAYHYVTHGVPLEINKAFDSIFKILESQPITKKLKRRIQKLQTEYEEQIKKIENKYPRGTNPLKSRIREARPAAISYIEAAKTLAKSILDPLRKYFCYFT